MINRSWARAVVGLCTLVAAGRARADDDPPPDAGPAGKVETVEIHETVPAEAASSVHLTAQDLAQRPHQNASDLLRQTPGLVVAQHAGGGKADQLFLRGFDADHGTDVAISVDGVPVNMPSHGHGQGYADSHWLIPETVAAIDVHKGPYAARFGDFYTAGAVEMTTLDQVDGGLRLALTGGFEVEGRRTFDDLPYRLVAMASPRLGAGKTLVAGELSYGDGPFENPQRFRHGHLFGKWRGPLGGGELLLASTFYTASWNQSGQIPERAVAAGTLGRFGAVDPSEGGSSSRGSLSLGWTRSDGHGGTFRVQGFGVGYRLKLFSNFTLFARDPENGDQIEQDDSRIILGLSTSYSRLHRLGSVLGVATAGVQVRADSVDNGLWHTRQRERLADCFGDGGNPCNHGLEQVRNISAYAEEDVFLLPWLEAIGGLRVDWNSWGVDDEDPETMPTAMTTSGSAQRAIVSPKLSLLISPTSWAKVFVNGGAGFHSNDARAAVASHGDGALARALGAEVGATVSPRPGLRGSLAAWYLHLSSEQVWSGDAGGTEPSDPTQRIGLDADVSWDATRWLTLDANLNLARSTLVANQGNGGALALAPRILGGGGVTFHRGPAMVALRGRGVGDRPANDDGTLTAQGFFVMDLVASYTHGPWLFGLTVNNVLDTEWREAQFAETSRLPGETMPVEDVHFTPGTPLAAFGTVQITL